MRLRPAPVCDDCWKSLTPQRGAVCLRCSEELHISAFTPVGGTERNIAEILCQPCRLAPPPFARAVAYGGYTGTLRELIHALKYDGILPIAERLGALLAEQVLQGETEPSWDSASTVASALDDLLVIAVPLHPSKRKQRGFNHAELLARAAVKVLKVRRPGVRLNLQTGLLERKKATQSQAGLSPRQRRNNLRGVFFVPKPELVAGRRVLLIDDIYTTGATARACSQVLLRAGAVSVIVATVARPQREIFAAAQFVPDELPMHEDVAFWGTEASIPVPQGFFAVSRKPPTLRGRDVFGQNHDSRA